ncbi:hypothetical protein [Amycolatopsis sp. NBC_00438]|uniref:hypothetical protein n=1 Tax=Amycolatopsis sp. NBC_00438 TaxID=2903558 RepID=UPI002E201150
MIIPDGVDVVFPDTAAAIDAGRAALVGHRDGGERTVLLVADVESGVRELLLPDPGLFDRAALLVGGGEPVVAMNHDRVLRVGADLDELLVDPGPDVPAPAPPVVAGWTAHSADGRAWPVRQQFNHDEPRYLRDLVVDAGTAVYGDVLSLVAADFPAAGQEDPDQLPDLGDVWTDGDERVVFVVGRGLWARRKHGVDFYGCYRLGPDGRVTARIWEETGLHERSGKHGVDGRFTHGGEYVILTPVFKSGGRQRVLRVADGSVRTVGLPVTTHLFDHVAGFWWARTETEVLRYPDDEVF